MLEQKQKLCESRDSDAFSGLPVQFYEYMVYCESLEFAQRPDYEYLESLFKTVLESEEKSEGASANVAEEASKGQATVKQNQEAMNVYCVDIEKAEVSEG